MNNTFAQWVRLYWVLTVQTGAWVPLERRPTRDATRTAEGFGNELLQRVRIEDLLFVDLAKGVQA